MATINVKRPIDLLGRSVRGTYRSLAHYTFDFEGVVEAIVIPAPGNTDHQVEFYVCGEYVSLRDCIALDYVPVAAP